MFAEYLRCFDAETIRATCDEYRAGAGIDLVHDRADRSRRLAMPLLMLWGRRSSQGSGYDVLGVWRDHAEQVPATPSTAAISSPRRRPRKLTVRCGVISRRKVLSPLLGARLAVAAPHGRSCAAQLLGRAPFAP